MEYTILQILLVFLVTFIAAIDQFSFLESLYQPIVTGMVIGLILGDLQTGLIVGGTYQLMTIGNMPVVINWWDYGSCSSNFVEA